MIDNTKHIIARLKLQPRHGAKKVSDIPADAADALGEFDTAFTRMTTSGLSLTSVLSDVYDSLNQLQTGTVASVTGLQKLIGVYQQFSKIVTDQTDQITKLFQRKNSLLRYFSYQGTSGKRILGF